MATITVMGKMMNNYELQILNYELFSLRCD